MKNVIFLLILLTLIQLSNSKAQTQPVFQTYKESINVFTDKDMYFAGEKIWFSAICSDNTRQSEKDKPLSKVLYIEIYNNLNGVIAKHKFNISENKVQGNISLPNDMATGNYFIRAYTRFMRNFPPEYFFYGVITVLNPDLATPNYTVKRDDIDFFPAGYLTKKKEKERWIIRLNNRLTGNTEKVQLIDTAQTIIAETLPFANGLGEIIFSADTANSYWVRCITSNSDTLFFPFTEKKKRDITIDCKKQKNTLIITVFNENNSNNSFHLYIKNASFETIAQQSLSVRSDTKQVDIPVKIFGSGLYYFLLVNQDNQPVAMCARMFEPDGEIQIKTAKKQYKPRQKVLANIEKSEDYRLIHAIVAKKGVFRHDDYQLPRYTLFSPLLLINYLKNNSLANHNFIRQVNMALRIFSYQYPAENNLFSTFFYRKADTLRWLPEMRDVSISGLVKDTLKNQPLSGIDVYASVLVENQQIHYTKTDENGEFIFSLNNMSGINQVLISVPPQSNPHSRILINNDFSNHYPELDDIPLSLTDTANIHLYKDLYINKQINQIFSETIEQRITEKRYSSVKLPVARTSVKLDDYIVLPTTGEVIKEIVPHTSIRYRKDSAYFTVFNTQTRQLYEQPMVLCDYMPVFDSNKILDINPKKIERIDVFNRIFILGDCTAYSIIAIYSRKNDLAGVSFPAVSVLSRFAAPEQQSKPLFPDYQTNGYPGNRPDFRTLLYMNANIETPELSFFTSDYRCDYEILIRAMDKDGTLWCYPDVIRSATPDRAPNSKGHR